MKTTLDIGLIGAGRIGVLHAATIAQQIPEARLFAVADQDLDAARSVADEHAVAHVFEDAEELFALQDVDAVVIASATDTHADFIIGAARAGKHVFCEKPIAYDLQEIDVALDAVADAGVKLQIGFNRRFDPNFSRVKQLVEAGEIGTPHILRITSRDPAPPPIEYVKVSGGLFFDMTIHDFDMARYLCGEVASVHAFGGALVNPAISQVGDIDTAVISLEFESGALGTIDNSRKATYGYDQRMEVFGSSGMVAAENESPHRTILANESGVHGPLPHHFFIQRYVASYRAELHAFVDAVTTDSDVPVTGADGRQPVVIARAAQRSLAERRPVALTEFD